MIRQESRISIIISTKIYLWFQSSCHATTSVVQDNVLWTALAWLQGHMCEACDRPVLLPMSSCSHCTMNLWNIWCFFPLKFAVIISLHEMKIQLCCCIHMCICVCDMQFLQYLTCYYTYWLKMSILIACKMYCKYNAITNENVNVFLPVCFEGTSFASQFGRITT